MLIRKTLSQSIDNFRIPISEDTACVGLNINGTYNANVVIEGFVAQSGQGYTLNLYDENGNIVDLTTGINTDVLLDVAGYQFISVSSHSWISGDINLTAVTSNVPRSGSAQSSGGGGGDVTSVFSRTGAVVAQSGDYTFVQIGSKPTTLSGYGVTDPVVLTSGSYSDPSWITSLAGSKISGNITGNAVSITGSISQSQVTGLTTVLSAKAPLNSPTFTGIPTGPTATVADSSTQLATTEFVMVAIGNIAAPVVSVFGRIGIVIQQIGDYTFAQIGSKPTTLSGYGITDPIVLTSGSYSDPSWITGLAGSKISGNITGNSASITGSISESQVTSLTSDLAAKAPLNSPTFTGTPAAPTASGGTNTTQLATTAFVTSAITAAAGVASFNTRVGAVTAQIGDYTFAQIGSTPTSLSGYGIADPVVLTSGSYNDPSWITALAGSKINGNITGNAVSITGSISESQVSGLTTDLAAKATDSSVVHLAGSEVITGYKEFTSGAGFNIASGSNLGILSISGSIVTDTVFSIQGIASQTGPYYRVFDSNSNILETHLPISGTDPRVKFNLYNTLETTLTNYERGSIFWDNTNNLYRIETQNGGTGTLRSLMIQGSGGRTLVGGTTDDLATTLQINGSALLTGQLNYQTTSIDPANTLGQIPGGVFPTGITYGNVLRYMGSLDSGGASNVTGKVDELNVTGAIQTASSIAASRIQLVASHTVAATMNIVCSYIIPRVSNAGHVAGTGVTVLPQSSATSTGNFGAWTYFSCSVPSLSGTGDFTSSILGFNVPNIGRATATSLTGFSVSDQTKGSGNATAFQGLIASATGKYNLRMTGTAMNVINGNTQIGGTVDPTTVLTVTGTFTSAGGAINLNPSSNFAVNISTGSTTSAVTIGNSANTLALLAPTTVTGAFTSAGGAVLINSSSNFTVGIGTGTTSSAVTIGNTANTISLAGPITVFAGTTTLSPLKFTSGVLNTSAVAGVVEFVTDTLSFTITTGTARKTIALTDIALTSGRVALSTTGGRLTDNSGLTFASGTGLGIGGTGAARLHTLGAISAAAWNTNGINIRTDAATYTDSSTATSGTVTNAAINAIGIPTIASTNTSVTYSNAGTLYIAGAPVNGTNVTITNARALWVEGASFFHGSASVSGGGVFVGGGVTRTAWGTAATSFSVQAQTLTDSSTAVSGTAVIETMASFLLQTLASTNATVTTTDAINVYIAGAVVKGTNNTATNTHALYIDAGNVGAQGTAYSLTVKAPAGATTNIAAQFLGITNINVSNNTATNINTGTSSGAVIIGNSSATLALNAPTTLGAQITVSDAINFAVGTSTGTVIGTATTQKLGFYGVTAIAQRSGAAQAAVATTASTVTAPFGYTTQVQADGIVTLVNELRNWAVAQGFIKGSA